MADDIRNSFPGSTGGFQAWGGNPRTSYLSGDGSMFYGMNVKDASSVMRYLVWSVATDGHITERLRLGPNAGQGTLAVDRTFLILTLFELVDNGQRTRRIAVPGWVR
jgi:hypothetical protein